MDLLPPFLIVKGHGSDAEITCHFVMNMETARSPVLALRHDLLMITEPRASGRAVSLSLRLACSPISMSVFPLLDHKLLVLPES